MIKRRIPVINGNLKDIYPLIKILNRLLPGLNHFSTFASLLRKAVSADFNGSYSSVG